jgi:hypothetical protein
MKLMQYRELPNNLFGLLFWNIFSAYMVIFIFLGLLALFGVQPVDFNNEPTFGFLGLISSIVMGPIMSLVTTLAIWVLLIMGNFVLKVATRLSGKNQIT